MEIWKDIEGYEAEYQISNHGRVKSLKNGKEQIIKGFANSKGYHIIDLYKNKEKKHFQVHRLVAKAFITNPNNYPIINHKDENPNNNHVSNLEWCDHRYNMNYGTAKERQKETFKKNGKMKKGKNPKAKKVLCRTTGEIFECMEDAKEKYKMKTTTHIVHCCTGERKTAGKHPVTGEGLEWEYYKQEIKEKTIEEKIKDFNSIKREMQQIQELLEELQEKKNSIKSMVFTERVQVSHDNNSIEKLLIRIEEQSDMYWDKYNELLEIQNEIEKAIEKLEPIEREVIRYKYFEGKTFEDIADIINYSFMTVRRIHKRSIEKLHKTQHEQQRIL